MIDITNATSEKVIALMLEQGEDLFDQARFRYIESMSRRSSQQRSAVSLILEKKIQRALVDYQEDLSQARECAKLVVNRIEVRFPESAKHIKVLYGQCDFSGIKNREEYLERSRSRASLSDLINRILLHDANLDRDQRVSSFNDLLQQQENEVVKLFAENAQTQNSEMRELKSVRIFRASQEKIIADKLVMQAIKEGPDNPGPINPHMLAIRSLTTMQGLSPQYLKRFVSYIDTVFWLEEANEKIKPVATKKSGGKR